MAISFRGPISPTSQRGNKYIICLIDILSKFVITKAVPNERSIYESALKDQVRRNWSL